MHFLKQKLHNANLNLQQSILPETKATLLSKNGEVERLRLL
jgi:hypothetical protein